MFENFNYLCTMKDRAYRRHMEETIVLRRLRRLASHEWWRFKDINGIDHNRQCVKDYIGTQSNFMYKTYTTTKSDSNYKDKYSPNKSCRYRNAGPKNRRERDKIDFEKLLQEYGLKHFNT